MADKVHEHKLRRKDGSVVPFRFKAEPASKTQKDRDQATADAFEAALKRQEAKRNKDVVKTEQPDDK